MNLLSDAKLCYVGGNAAYFTTQNLADQWGDDWNDAPYEHNAGAPYTFGDWDKEHGKEPWEIVQVYYEGAFELPSEWFHNSPYSVEQINKKETPWLKGSRYSKLDGKVEIWAGTSLAEFIRTILECAGEIYLPIKMYQALAKDLAA